MNTIGTDRRNAVAIFRQFGIAAFRKILRATEFEDAARKSSCLPRRRRILVPETIAWRMIFTAQQTTSMTKGLSLVWGFMHQTLNLSKTVCSEEAFCQARKRLSLSFWRQLWKTLLTKYEHSFDAVCRWKGLPPIGDDGTGGQGGRSAAKTSGTRNL